MNFQFNCPQCGKLIEAAHTNSGQVAECPHCGKGIVVPQYNSNAKPNIKRNCGNMSPSSCGIKVTSKRCHSKRMFFQKRHKQLIASNSGVQTRCQYCGTEYEIEQDDIGSEVDCQVCGNRFVVKSNIQSNKQDKEKIIFRVKPSMAPVIATVIAMGVLPLCLAFFALLFNMLLGVCAITVIVVFMVIIFIQTSITYDNIDYIISNKRVIIKSGTVVKNIRQVHVHDMRDILLVRGIFHRITGTGSISIASQTTGLFRGILITDIKEYQWFISTLESLKLS